jgi:Flp pilus assembly protein TadG
MSNQRGVVTINFMIALIIGFGMATILFAMSMTLMVTELTQYATFSAARAHAAANKDPSDQETAARDKYDSMIRSNVLAPFFSNGWFTVSPKGELEVRSGNTGSGAQASFKDDYPSAKEANREIWTGVRTKFVARVLSLKLPMIGSTTQDDEGLSARVVTILIREPSQNECQKFIKDRYDVMMKLDSRFAINGYTSHQSDYVAMEDNGC